MAGNMRIGYVAARREQVGNAVAAVKSHAVAARRPVLLPSDVASRLLRHLREIEYLLSLLRAQDEAEAARITAELGQFAPTVAVGLLGRRIADYGGGIVARAGRLWGKVDRLAHEIGQQAEAPSLLQDAAGRWYDGVGRLTEAMTELEELKALEGWSGEAAERYGLTSAVQRAATQELSGVTTAVGDSLEETALLNSALQDAAADVLGDLRLELKAIQRRIQATPERVRLQRAYPRTTAAVEALRQALPALRSVREGRPVEARLDDLCQGVESTKVAPAVLSLGSWPSGPDKAGVEPRDPNEVGRGRQPARNG